MPSALGMMGQSKVQAAGGQDIMLRYIAMVAKIAGDITKDEQLLQIAAAMGEKK
jgi:hypothetical protein